MKISLISLFPDIQCFGIRTLSACLKQEGHDVDLFFLLKQYWEKYDKQTLDEFAKLTEKSDLIGISLMTNFFDNAVQVTRKLRENSNACILWGGVHPTIRPIECLGYADMIAIGESEQALVEVTRKIQNKQYYYDTKGMWFRDKEKIIKNPNQPLPGTPASMYKHLDQVPFQDYDYDTHFILRNDGIQKMDINFMNSMLDVYLTMPTRGCPFACTFCVNNYYMKMHPHQKPIRKRSVDHIIKEIVDAKNRFSSIEFIKFEDDAFFLMSREEMKDFSIQYKEKVKLPLIILGATPSTLTKEKFSLMVDAGLWEIRMGIQSAGANTKRIFKRPHSNKRVFHATNIANRFKHKVRAKYDIIIDSPWETDQDQIETLMFLAKIKTPWLLNLFSLTFYPGTDLYDRAKKDGIITDDLNEVYRKSFHGYRKTYLNALFFILKDYVEIGLGIHPKIMSLLTNQSMMKLRMHKLLFIILKKIFIVAYPIFRAKRLIQLGFSDLKEGNLTRIKMHLRKKNIFLGFFSPKRSMSNIDLKPKESITNKDRMSPADFD